MDRGMDMMDGHSSDEDSQVRMRIEEADPDYAVKKLAQKLLRLL
jgi:hypothetical protein